MPLSWIGHSDLIAALLTGLLGGVHCLGMCGGIVSALSFSQAQTPHSTSRFPVLLAYNAGRISSYTLAGLIAGGLGAASLSLAGLQQTQQILASLAGLVMILLGLYMAGIWHGVIVIEKAGARLWKHLEPAGRRFMPVRTPWQAIPFGMVWGWLPCGLVYTVLISSLSAGSMLKGGILMLVFGIGTLPSLLLMGTLANQVARWTRQPTVRLLAGLSVCILGLLMVLRQWWPPA